MPEKNNNRNTSAATDLEQGTVDATLRANEAPRILAPCRINFHSVRHRLADIDGLSGKAVLDGIVLAGILSDDSPKFVKEVSHSQTKGNKAEAEKTIVTIEHIEEGLFLTLE
jgi:hypothetical protein